MEMQPKGGGFQQKPVQMGRVEPGQMAVGLPEPHGGNNFLLARRVNSE